MKVEERFLNYVSIWTTSDDDSETTPSTTRQFELARLLEGELKKMGLIDVSLNDRCYLYARLPATRGMEGYRSVGFIAHMDTAPDYCGQNVKPQIIENYDGGDIFLKGSEDYIRVNDFPNLQSLKGRTLITGDGTTLLGADDKAGIAVIMTGIEEIIDSGVPHPDVWIGFTPDEEIGRGADCFDLDIFKADFAYTVDGGYEGEIAYENFNAQGATFNINGVNVHPGEAKDIMVNAALIACEIAASLPEEETPSHTTGRQGFFHLCEMKGDVSKAELHYIVRDHDMSILEDRLSRLRNIEDKMNAKYGPGTVSLEIKHSYDNMISVIEDNMYVVEIAREAIRKEGIEPESEPVRGGTDGARLSFMGLPCPNLGAGGYAFHGPYEHISVEGMRISVNVIKNIICQLS